MCVQTELQDHGTRLTALESKNNTPDNLVALNAQVDKIYTYLFGGRCVPDVPRDKSNVVVKS